METMRKENIYVINKIYDLGFSKKNLDFLQERYESDYYKGSKHILVFNSLYIFNKDKNIALSVESQSITKSNIPDEIIKLVNNDQLYINIYIRSSSLSNEIIDFYLLVHDDYDKLINEILNILNFCYILRLKIKNKKYNLSNKRVFNHIDDIYNIIDNNFSKQNLEKLRPYNCRVFTEVSSIRLSDIISVLKKLQFKNFDYIDNTYNYKNNIQQIGILLTLENLKIAITDEDVIYCKRNSKYYNYLNLGNFIFYRYPDPVIINSDKNEYLSDNLLEYLKYFPNKKIINIDDLIECNKIISKIRSGLKLKNILSTNSYQIINNKLKNLCNFSDNLSINNIIFSNNTIQYDNIKLIIEQDENKLFDTLLNIINNKYIFYTNFTIVYNNFINMIYRNIHNINNLKYTIDNVEINLTKIGKYNYINNIRVYNDNIKSCLFNAIKYNNTEDYNYFLQYSLKNNIKNIKLINNGLPFFYYDRFESCWIGGLLSFIYDKKKLYLIDDNSNEYLVNDLKILLQLQNKNDIYQVTNFINECIKDLNDEVYKIIIEGQERLKHLLLYFENSLKKLRNIKFDELQDYRAKQHGYNIYHKNRTYFLDIINNNIYFKAIDGNMLVYESILDNKDVLLQNIKLLLQNKNLDPIIALYK